MANIIQRNRFGVGFGSCSQDAGITRQLSRHRSRRSRYGRDVSARAAVASGANYSMQQVTQPPTRARFGRQMDGSFTVELRSRRDAGSAHSEVAYGRLLAVASLVAANHDGSTTPLRSGILAGPQLIDAVHAPSAYGDQHGRHSDVLGYISFGGLSIYSLGTFRIRVTLLRMASEDADFQGGAAIQAMDSEPFVVNP